MFPNQKRRNKTEEHYQLVRQSLQDNGITSIEQAEDKIVHIFKGARRYSIIAVIIGAIAVLMLPTQALMCGILLVCVLIWIWSSSLAGKRYIRRYINEDIQVTTDNTITDSTTKESH